MSKLTVFFDGACPLCSREISWLRKRDPQGHVFFVDIATADFDPGQYDRTFETFMAELHGRRADGDWVVGVPLFAELYEAVGFPVIARILRNRFLSPLWALGYRVFALGRLRLPGRRPCGTADASCRIPSDGGQT